MVVAFSRETPLAVTLLWNGRVIYQDSPMTLPYAIPKVGRRSSDRQLLDEWYARHAATGDQTGQARAVNPLRPHPAARAIEGAQRPLRVPDRRVARTATPAIG